MTITTTIIVANATVLGPAPHTVQMTDILTAMNDVAAGVARVQDIIQKAGTKTTSTGTTITDDKSMV